MHSKYIGLTIGLNVFGVGFLLLGIEIYLLRNVPQIGLAIAAVLRLVGEHPLGLAFVGAILLGVALAIRRSADDHP